MAPQARRPPGVPTIEAIKGLYGSAQANLYDYYEIATRCHEYVLNNSTEEMISLGYSLRSGGINLDVRPIKHNLFIWDVEEFKNRTSIFEFINNPSSIELNEVNRHKYRSILYTIQKSIESFLDLKVDAQQARKVVGEVFQGFVSEIFKTKQCLTLGGGVSFTIPAIQTEDTEEDQEDHKVKLSFDLLVRKFGSIRNADFQETDIICGVKTTTKDRGNMFFVDRYLYHQTQTTRPKFIAVCLNDVQRKKNRLRQTVGVSFTFLPGHFKLYEHVFGQLDGYYFIDPPPRFEETALMRENLNTMDKLMLDHLPIWHSNA